MKNIDLRLIECLDALVREQSVTLAAGHLGVSQGHMSNSLARLRDLFGDPILVRTSKGMIPTKRALELRADAQDLTRRLEEMLGVHHDRDLATVDRVVRIACADAVALAVVSPKLNDIRTAAPNLQIQITQISSAHLREPLEDGSLDLVIGAYVNLPGALQISRLRSARMRCAVNVASIFAKNGIDLNSYCEQPHAILIYGYGLLANMEIVTNESLLLAGQQRNILLSAQYASMIIDAVARSGFIATMPDIVIDQLSKDGSVVGIDPPVELPDLTLSMVWHPRSKSDWLLSWVRDCLRDQFR